MGGHHWRNLFRTGHNSPDMTRMVPKGNLTMQRFLFAAFLGALPFSAEMSLSLQPRARKGIAV